MLRKLTAVMLSLCLFLPVLALATQSEEDSDVSLEDALIQAGVISVTITNEDGETVSDEDH